MVIGIITETKESKRIDLTSRIFRIMRKERIMDERNPFDAAAVILPYSRREIEGMSKKRLLSTINKASNFLKKQGVQKLVLSKYIKEICREKEVSPERISIDAGRGLFYKLVPECIRKTASKCGLNLLKASVCITDTKMDRITEYLIRALCYDIKKLTVCTKNLKKAMDFCDGFFDETGFSVAVRENPVGNADIIIDIDNNILQIGQGLFVTDVNMGYEFFGFSVLHLDALACLPKTNTENLTCFYDYSKKKLTL